MYKFPRQVLNYESLRFSVGIGVQWAGEVRRKKEKFSHGNPKIFINVEDNICACQNGETSLSSWEPMFHLICQFLVPGVPFQNNQYFIQCHSHLNSFHPLSFIREGERIKLSAGFVSLSYPPGALVNEDAPANAVSHGAARHYPPSVRPQNEYKNIKVFITHITCTPEPQHPLCKASVDAQKKEELCISPGLESAGEDSISRLEQERNHK